MCLAVYLASNNPLNLVNKVEGEISFYIRDLEESENFVYQNFTKRFVYYVGSSQECSCGFLMDGIYPDMPEFADIRETYHIFSIFLQNILKGEELEIYVCWGGEESEKPVKFNTLKAGDIGQTDFNFEERHFYTIERFS
jgi:hypothetical protein